MKRLIPLLAFALCGCAQNEAERRDTVGKVLLTPVVATLAILDATDSDPDPEFTEWVKDWNREHPVTKP